MFSSTPLVVRWMNYIIFTFPTPPLKPSFEWRDNYFVLNGIVCSFISLALLHHGWETCYKLRCVPTGKIFTNFYNLEFKLSSYFCLLNTFSVTTCWYFLVYSLNLLCNRRKMKHGWKWREILNVLNVSSSDTINGHKY